MGCRDCGARLIKEKTTRWIYDRREDAYVPKDGVTSACPNACVVCGKHKELVLPKGARCRGCAG